MEGSTTWATKSGVGTFDFHISNIDNDGKPEIVTVANIDSFGELTDPYTWCEDTNNPSWSKVRIHNSLLATEAGFSEKFYGEIRVYAMQTPKRNV